MNFAAPLNLLWLLPAWTAITVIYLLRRPRRNVDVASTVFWRSVPQESVRRAKIQKFTPQLIWLLQLIASLLLVLGLMQPQIRSRIAEGTPIAIVIDNGVSSACSDLSGTRLQAEKNAALNILGDSKLAHSKVTIVSTAPAGVVGDQGSSVAQARGVITSLSSSDGQPDLMSAVSAASSSLHSEAKFGQTPKIMLLSDMAWDGKLDQSVQDAANGITIDSDPTGEQFATNNPSDAAITRFAIQRSNIDPTHVGDVFVQVSTTSMLKSAHIHVTADGKAPIDEPVSATPEHSGTISFQMPLPATSQVVTAQLVLPEPFGDQLSADNTAYAVLPPSGGSHVLLVSDGDSALSRALAILPGVDVTQVSPQDYASSGAQGLFDVTIFDGVAPSPKHAVSGGEMVWGGGDRSFTSNPASPDWQRIVDWQRSDPVLRFVDFGNAGVKASAWSRVGGWTPLIEAQNGVIAASSNLGGQRKIRMSFEPSGSGFDASLAFPIFISNCVNWLSGSAGGESDTAGMPIALPRTKSGWSVSGPSGGESGLCSSMGTQCDFNGTQLAGVYTASSAGSSELYVRNCPPSSVDLSPKDHPFLKSGNIEFATGAKKQINWQPEIAPAIAICILFLIAEWVAYHKPMAKVRV